MLLFVWQDNRTAVAYIRLSQYFHARKFRLLSRWMMIRLRRDFGCMVSLKAHIGAGLKMPHPNGIVIGEGVVIGERCTIYQQVTLGGARLGDWQGGRYPEVGNDVTLFAGAKLVGAITIGSDVTVGANAVVTRDIPAGHNAVGIPAVARPKREAASA